VGPSGEGPTHPMVDGDDEQVVMETFENIDDF
jgi:hypothetical protein